MAPKGSRLTIKLATSRVRPAVAPLRRPAAAPPRPAAAPLAAPVAPQKPIGDNWEVRVELTPKSLFSETTPDGSVNLDIPTDHEMIEEFSDVCQEEDSEEESSSSTYSYTLSMEPLSAEHTPEKPTGTLFAVAVSSTEKDCRRFWQWTHAYYIEDAPVRNHTFIPRDRHGVDTTPPFRLCV